MSGEKNVEKEKTREKGGILLSFFSSVDSDGAHQSSQTIFVIVLTFL